MLGVTDIRPWSGKSSGRFHIDFLGVKTDPAFWRGLQRTPAGDRRLGHPGLSHTYFEYEACIQACTAVARPFRVLEIGGGWGVWAVRAAMVAQRVGVPVRTTIIEMMAEHCAQISRHFMANCIDPRCHLVLPAAVAARSGDGWIRAAGEVDPGARLVPDDWVRRNAVIPADGIPCGVPVPCRDGTRVTRTRTQRLASTIKAGTPFDFVHFRIGSGPTQFLDDPVLEPKNIGLLVLPQISAVDLAQVEDKLEAQGYVKVFGVDHGQVLHGSRGEVKIAHTLRIYAGERIPRELTAEMSDRMSAIGRRH